jgi:hypothetical protein
VEVTFLGFMPLGLRGGVARFEESLSLDGS